MMALTSYSILVLCIGLVYFSSLLRVHISVRDTILTSESVLQFNADNTEENE